ncbi:MAG: UDP-N-acetylmuramate dehydrogenase [Acidobacteriota bacterium]
MTTSTFGDIETLTDVPLAPHTTLGVGGPARWWARATDTEQLRTLLRIAHERELATYVLGGGSNVLISDQGFDGLVLGLDDTRLELSGSGPDHVDVDAGAGIEWDSLVARCVEAGLGGLECLSGIPGRVGAAPMQNIGAYGQEVAETIHHVDVVDRQTLDARVIPADACGFAYRNSHFKGSWRDRFVITRVRFRLPRRTLGTVRYAELMRRLDVEANGPRPSLATVREAVLAIRREKSMVIDPSDANSRSAGSFFVNPVVDPEHAETIRRTLETRGVPRPLPTYPAGDRVKIPAAFLIEAAGFTKGHQHGRAGLSSRHVLALINRGGATATELVELAAAIRSRVAELFTVTLRPEPLFVGFTADATQVLDAVDSSSVANRHGIS